MDSNSTSRAQELVGVSSATRGLSRNNSRNATSAPQHERRKSIRLLGEVVDALLKRGIALFFVLFFNINNNNIVAIIHQAIIIIGDSLQYGDDRKRSIKLGKFYCSVMECGKCSKIKRRKRCTGKEI